MKKHKFENFDGYILQQQRFEAKVLNKIETLQAIVMQQSMGLMRMQNELYFAHLLHDTIVQSNWLKDKTLSLFGWAANYSFIYALYRVLDKVCPLNILEMGLGQTTHLTSQYIAYRNPQAHLTVCEQSKDWIEIYKSELPQLQNIEIKYLDVQNFEYENQINQKYAYLIDYCGTAKFDLIIVDGPIGDGMNLPRSNILDLVSHDNLAEDFVIIFDDVERKGEQNTIAITENLLRTKGKRFSSFVRGGLKMQYVIVSESRNFIRFL